MQAQRVMFRKRLVRCPEFSFQVPTLASGVPGRPLLHIATLRANGCFRTSSYPNRSILLLKQNRFARLQQFFEGRFGRDEAWAAAELSFEVLVMYKPFANQGDFDLGSIHFPDLAGLERFHRNVFV